MKLSQKIKFGALILYAKALKRRLPLGVSWSLTDRCNYKCKYCDIHPLKTKELSTKQVFGIIDELKKLHTQRIIFTGGEPLLREDIGKILSYCKEKKIFVGINTNGSLVEEKEDAIKYLDVLQLSFDGPKEVNDLQRCKGSYDDVVKALAVAKRNGIRVEFNTTLTKYNVDYIDSILKFAEKHKVKVHFQPVAYLPLGNLNVEELIIPPKKYKKIFDYLIALKGKNKYIANTTDGLKYLREYPKGRLLKCGAGKIHCLIATNGEIYPCTVMENKTKTYNCARLGFKSAFEKLEPVNCDSCWCNKTLEVSQLFSLNPKSIIETIFSS